LQDYDHHATYYYAPDVERARIRSTRRRSFSRLIEVFCPEEDPHRSAEYGAGNHLLSRFADAGTQPEFGDPHRRSGKCGTPEEQEKTPGNDNGFMWRLETCGEMEERDGGVYVQNEAVSLTRDIPGVLAWMIEPFLTSIPKNRWKDAGSDATGSAGRKGR